MTVNVSAGDTQESVARRAAYAHARSAGLSEGEMDVLSGRVKQFLLTLRERDEGIRREFARKLTGLCNEDWHPDEQLTEEEFAGRIKLQGVVVDSGDDDAELFYDDDIFAGHSVTAFMNFDGRISEPNLAG